MIATWCAFAGLLAGSSQEPAPLLTLVCTGARLKPAIAQIAAATKLQLQVAPAIADSEVVAFTFKDVPTNDALARIADAVDARWDKIGDVLTLSPDVSKRQAQLAAARKKKLDSLRKQISVRLNPPKPDPKKKREGEEEVEAYEPEPGELVIVRILSQIDLNPIVDLGDEGRVVYASAPNRMQRSMRVLPAWVNDSIAAHNEQVAAEKAARTEAEAEGEEEVKWRKWMKRMGMDPDRKKVEVKETPAKVLLVVERPGMSMFGTGGVECTLKLYDGKGNVLLTQNDSFTLGDSDSWMGRAMSEAVATPGEQPQKPPPPDTSPKMAWSDLAKGFEAYGTQMQASFMGGTMPEMPKPLKEALSRPEDVEPLSIVVGDGLVKCAAQKGLNLVAALPDDAFQLGFSGTSLAPTVDKFVGSLKAAGGLSFVEKDGWWVVQPSDRVRSRRSRVDRGALGEIVRASGFGGRLRLVDLARFAARTETPFASAVGMSYLMVASPSLLSFMFGGADWTSMRFYGQLSEPQRVMLESGQTLALNGLSPMQSASASQIVYGARPQIQIGPPPEDQQLGGLFGMAFSFMGRENEEADYRKEPTELCPNGLPAQGFLAIPVREEFLLAPTGPPSFMDFMDSGGMEGYAMLQMMRENPAMAGNQAIPEVKEVRVGKRRLLNLTFNLAPDAAIRKVLKDDNVDPNSKPVKMDALPADVKAALAKALADLKKMDLPFMDPSMFGGGRPPIPPK